MKLGGGDTANIALSFLSQTSSESHWEAQYVRLITAGPKEAGACTPTHALLITRIQLDFPLYSEMSSTLGSCLVVLGFLISSLTSIKLSLTDVSFLQAE